MFITAKSGITAGVEKFLELGLNINTVDPKGKTVLMIAAEDRHQLMVDALLKANAKIGITSKDGRDALMHACAANPGSGKVIQSLLDKGANVNNKDHHEDSALVIAAKNAQGMTADIFEQLITAGADSASKNKAKKLLEQQLAAAGIDQNSKEKIRALVALL